MKASALTPGRLALGIIVIPMLLASIYYLFIAQDRYTTDASIAVRSVSTPTSSSSTGTSSSLSFTSDPASLQDTLYLLEFVHSQGIAMELDKQLKLQAHFQQSSLDWFFRLSPGASQEKFLDYYRDRIEVEFDDVTSLVNIRTQAFSREMSLALNKALLAACERFVNEFSQRMANEATRFNEREVERTSLVLQEAKDKVSKFQAKNRLLDPVATSAAATSLTSELQATLARQESDLKSMLAYMQPDAYSVQTLRNQIAATRAQLEAEKIRATSSNPGSDRLNELNAEYQKLLLQATLAEDSYRGAATALDAARLDSTRMLKNLVIVQAPAIADSARYPERAFNLITLFVICSLLYVIVRLIVATVQEHQD